MRVPFAQVAVFADGSLRGNPAAVLILPRWPDDATLLGIAADNAVPQTAFLVATDDGVADHALRWFSPTAEVTLCGHGTIAAAHVAMAGLGARRRRSFATRRSGVLTVEREGAEYRLTLPSLAPAPCSLPQVVAALGVADPVETLWHDGGYAVVVLADPAAVPRVRIDRAALVAAGRIMTIVTAPGDATDIVSRVFVPAFGTDEDPVTGSAHAVIAPYWSERLGRAALSAEQASARGGRMRCRVDGDRVVIGGTCVTAMEGKYTIADFAFH